MWLMYQVVWKMHTLWPRNYEKNVLFVPPLHSVYSNKLLQYLKHIIRQSVGKYEDDALRRM